MFSFLNISTSLSMGGEFVDDENDWLPDLKTLNLNTPTMTITQKVTQNNVALKSNNCIWLITTFLLLNRVSCSPTEAVSAIRLKYFTTYKVKKNFNLCTHCSIIKVSLYKQAFFHLKTIELHKKWHQISKRHKISTNINAKYPGHLKRTL